MFCQAEDPPLTAQVLLIWQVSLFTLALLLHPPLVYARHKALFTTAACRNSKVRKGCEQDSEGRACTKKRRGIFQADTCCVQADPSSIQALPTDVLLHVFTFTHPKAQREVLPLVCRQWQEVLQGPVALWRHLELDFPAAMDLGLNGASLAPSRRFQVCFTLYDATLLANRLCCMQTACHSQGLKHCSLGCRKFDLNVPLCRGCIMVARACAHAKTHNSQLPTSPTHSVLSPHISPSMSTAEASPGDSVLAAHERLCRVITWRLSAHMKGCEGSSLVLSSQDIR